LTVRLQKPATFSLHVRHPGWVATNAFAARVNGELVHTASTPSSYVALEREWRDGDRVEIEIPMRTTVERLPDGSDWVALLHGPIVLVSPAGTDNLTGLRADDSRMGHVASGPMMPLDEAPVLVSSLDELPSHVALDAAAGPMRFRLSQAAVRGTAEGLPLMPFFRLHDARYQMYWQLRTEDGIR
jgi:DUF1680 family protein